MAARKGKGRQAVRNSGGGFPTWAAVLVGVLIGAVALAVLMRHSLMPMAPKDGPQANPQATAAAPSDAGAVAPGNAESAPKKPQFDFYSVLSEKEVRIPDAELSAQAKAEQQQKQAAATPTPNAAPTAPAASPAPTGNAPVATQNVVAAPAAAIPKPSASSGYLLQVGAFPNPSDAETMKAKLAMQGFVANVQSVTINGQTFHRVRLGPFPSASALEATKQRLSGAGISSIALKEGK
ncbi:SPOR domain-containing protein [Rhodanobacter sp. DHG33]|uniref:SPOR domain-containing protein n=1 Tax=Rhodanobacter sp. DHG33 TaxID=2775921 RepID=UPI001784F9DC|nr:SPOR domain-containing protein [Rhodanobacter sp. DHG33]MBD8898864.1 SPOR domain-containing protein [Rhodanobacter sp. DHG33]